MNARWKRADDGFVESHCGRWKITPIYGGLTQPESYELRFDQKVVGSGETQRQCKDIEEGLDMENKKLKNNDFDRKLDHAEALKVNYVERERSLRLYCTQSESAWTLQVRTPVKLANGRDGADFIVACASLDRPAMEALRNAIDQLLVHR